MALGCHVTLQDHIIKALYNFMIRSLLRYITILANLVAIDTVIVEIYWFYFVTWSRKTNWSKGDVIL